MVTELDSARPLDIKRPDHSEESANDDLPTEQPEFHPIVLTAHQTAGGVEGETWVLKSPPEGLFPIHCQVMLASASSSEGEDAAYGAPRTAVNTPEATDRIFPKRHTAASPS